MDAGGWMGIHTVCFILQNRREFREITVSIIVTMVRSGLGERYEIATCRPDPGDVESMQALGRGATRGIVDPLRGRIREQFDPRENPFQSSEERPAGGGYYVGIRAIQGQSVTGVLDLRLCAPIYDRYTRFFDLTWHATNWDCVQSILELSLIHISEPTRPY